MNPKEPVSIGTFPSVADAQIAQGVLTEAGVESVIRADNAGGMYPALSGADLLVRAEDAQRAAEILEAAETGNGEGGVSDTES